MAPSVPKTSTVVGQRAVDIEPGKVGALVEVEAGQAVEAQAAGAEDGGSGRAKRALEERGLVNFCKSHRRSPFVR